MRTLIIPALMLALVASGCARNTDSRTAGFVNGILNQTDGTYARQREELRTANADAAAENAGLEVRNSALEGERARLARDTEYARGKLSSLRRKLSAAKKRHAASSAQYKAAQQREAQLARLERDVNAGNRAGDANRVSAAARRLAKLEREIDG